MSKLDKLHVPSYKDESVEGSNLEARSLSAKTRKILPNQVTACGSPKLPSLPPLVFNGNIEYIQTLRAAEAVASEIEVSRPGVLGFDLEWKVSFVKGEAPRPTATLQLCAPLRPPGCPESPVWGTAFVFHLSQIRGHPGTPTASGGTDLSSEAPGELPEIQRDCHGPSSMPDSLVRVLSDPDILLVGVGISGDVRRLKREYTELRQRRIKGIVDLCEMAKAKVPPDSPKKGSWSLADLCREMMKLDLAKPRDLRISNWEKVPLSVQQLNYAATDAYAGLRLWQVMEAMPNMLGHSAVSGGQGRGPDGGKEVSARRRVSAAKLETYRLWYDDGLSMEAVAEARSIKTSTALQYITDCVEAGLPYEWRRLNIDPQMESDIVHALRSVRAEASNVPPTVADEDGTPARSPSGERASRDEGDLPQIIEEKGACAEGSKRAGAKEASLQEEYQDTSSGKDSTGSGWENVSLKKVKDRAPPQAEYWQIKLILARLKSGWSKHDALLT